MNEMTIDLPERLTIHHIEALYGDLKFSFLSDTKILKINADKIESIDTSGLQVLLILIKSAVSAGKTIHWENPTETLMTAARQIGLDKKLQLT